ncbi:MAG: sodium:solute symporter family protein [Chlamydiota bacterium]
MNIPLFFGLVGLLGTIYIWIGKCASKDLQTSEDYFLMGRKLTFFPLSLTLLATQLGGGTLLGAAQEAYLKGWLVLFYPLGMSLGLFVLGMGFGGKLQKLNISTVAEIFEKVYGSKYQRYIASGLSIVALFFILVAQGIAARLFFVAMGAENPAIFIIFWSVLVGYTVMGGLKAVVNTDILQALFIVTTLALAFFSVDTSLVPVSLSIPSAESIALSEIPWSSWLFMPLLFMLIEQDMGQRCFAAKNSRVISMSALTAGTVLLFSSIVAIYFGVVAREIGIEVTDNASVLIESIKALTNPFVATLFMVAIFLAVISTADSLLCSIASNLSCDFLVLQQSSDAQRVRLSQLLTLITGISSLGIAYLFDNVVTVLMISYELSVCILFVPITAAVLSKRPSRVGAYFSMTFGAAGFVIFRFLNLPVPKEMITICFSLLGYLIGTRFDVRQGLPKKVEEIKV